MAALSDLELAVLLLEAGFPRDPKVIAEGLGIIHGESGGDPSSKVPGNSHIGLWALSPDFGSEADRLDPLKATIAARKQWEEDGSFWRAWGQWQAQQAGHDGAKSWRTYLPAVQRALRGVVADPTRRDRQPANQEVGVLGSPLMRFLLTASLGLVGLALVGFGLSRAVGSSPAAAAAEAKETA